MHSSEHEVQPPISLLTLQSYKETSEFPELKSAELSEIWRMLDVLSTAGSWARNYPFKKKIESKAAALPWKQHAVKSSGRWCASLWPVSRHCLVALHGHSVRPRQPASTGKCHGPWTLLCFTKACAGASLTTLPTAQDGCRLLKSTAATRMVDP